LALPAKLKMDTLPPVPSGTRIDPDTTVPGFGLITDVVGFGDPVGQTVMNEAAVTSESTVMFNSTETAPAGTGMPARFGAVVVKGSSTVAPGPTGAAAATPTGGVRVSRTRVGVTPMNPSGVELPWEEALTLGITSAAIKPPVASAVAPISKR
jgi:hypothetical protein